MLWGILGVASQERERRGRVLYAFRLGSVHGTFALDSAGIVGSRRRRAFGRVLLVRREFQYCARSRRGALYRRVRAWLRVLSAVLVGNAERRRARAIWPYCGPARARGPVLGDVSRLLRQRNAWRRPALHDAVRLRRFRDLCLDGRAVGERVARLWVARRLLRFNLCRRVFLRPRRAGTVAARKK